MNTAGVDGIDSLTLLVLADLHYVGEASHRCPLPTRQTALGLELAERAVRRTLRHVRPDALVLLGDLVDNGLAPGAQHDVEAIAHALEEFGLPILVAPGNHDVAADLVAHVFGHGHGLHVVNGHPIVLLAPGYGEDDSTTYREADLALVRDAAAAADRPLIVLQHNPVHPHIAGSYPYNPTNAEAIKACYAAAGVALSLSGHYHAGVPPERVDGVCYATAPALCEAPFGFLEVRLADGQLAVTDRALALPGDVPLTDTHCHTHYAYCRDDVTLQGAIERARLMGVRRQFITEHAGQLYLPPEDFWSTRFFDDPGLIARTRHTPACRMDAYLAEALPLRSDAVRLGLEVDSDGRGGITLLDEDRSHWDLLIGAVHWIPRFDGAAASPAELRRRFMDASESVARAGVHALAHPFRYFRRAGHGAPSDLYRPMAQMLAAAGVAAEINFHTHAPDPDFVAACLEEGVRIALATDSHSLWEVGELSPHLDVLRAAGCTRPADMQRVLFCP